MLQSLREKSKTWVGFLLAGFLILLFALWGAEGIFQLGFRQGDAVIEVGDAAISGTEFEETYRRSIQVMEQRRNTQIDYAEAKRNGYLQAIIDEVVELTLLDQAAEASGLTVSDAVVRAEIRSNPRFQTGGQFDQGRYLQTLSLIGMSEAQYVAELKQEILRRYVLFATASARPGPSSYIDALYRHRKESRTVEVAVIPYDSITGLPEPSESDLREIYERDPKTYTAPEYRKVSFLVVTQELLAKRAEITDEQIREVYERDKETEFRKPEERIVEHIVFKTEEDARRGAQALKEGKDFAAVAREIANGAPIDLGSVARSEIPIDSIRDVAFGMDSPGASDPVQSPFGWHLVRVVNIAPEKIQPLSEVRDTIEDRLRRNAARQALDEMKIRLEDMVDNLTPLEEIAKEIGVDVVTIEALDAEGRNPAGAALQNLPADTEFLERVFIFDEGETSDVRDAGDSTLYIMRVEKITPSQLKPFDSVRDALRAVWEQEARARRAKEQAERVAELVRSGQSLREAAQSVGAAVQTSRLVARGQPSTPEGAGNALQAKAFSSPQGEPFVAQVDGGAAVGIVRDSTKPEIDHESDDYKETVSAFRTALAGEVTAQYTAELRARFPVTVHMDRIDQLLGLAP